MATKNTAIFPRDTVDFLQALKANNNRDWFKANKERYEAAIKWPAEAFSDEMVRRLEKLTKIAHTGKVFRIHRDVRFSKDKTPYNAHLRVSFTPRHGTADPPAWFFGVDPQGCAMGAGYLAFDKQRLDSFRSRIDKLAGKSLIKLLDRLRKDGFRISEPELKRVPSPFAGDHPRADLLRRKESIGVDRH